MLSPRQRKILRLIEDHQRVRVDDLADRFSTTPQTIRKDLQRLADLHHIVRFQGGASLVGGVEYATPSTREGDAPDAKRAIGAAVIGAAALSDDGLLLDFDLAEVQVCRAMMVCARHVILAIDASKFGRSAPVTLGTLEGVHTVVTDSAAPPWVAPLCEAADVELITAAPAFS